MSTNRASNHSRALLAVLGALFAALGVARVAAQATAPRAQTVLTATQATYSLATALTADTPIEAVNVPADGRQWSLLKDYLERRKEALAPTFAAATAAITLTNALPADPLYRFAREANIRIVDIDAAVPWALERPGVALVAAPASNVPWGADPDATGAETAPYLWLSVSNAIRMGDLIAHDLAALFPAEATAIAANLDDLKRELLALRTDYERRAIEATDDTVFALTGDFVYLTNDLGLFVDGYFIKQDVRWTDDDLASLTAHLRDRGIKVVIHKWQPSEAIQEAVRAAGAKLVVLDAGDPGLVAERALVADGLQRILASNLEALAAALSSP
jgi:ABC-type Zn uptake system ZnuABC Zn-binding protein ZnuA